MINIFIFFKEIKNLIRRYVYNFYNKFIIVKKPNHQLPCKPSKEEDEECSVEKIPLSAKSESKRYKLKQIDVLRVYYFMYVFTCCALLAKFWTFMFTPEHIQICLDTSKLAITLNVFIIFVGTAEGLRSISATVNYKVGESCPVPKYKLDYLFGYLISFSILTVMSVTFDYIVKGAYSNSGLELPDFNADNFLDGLVSNTVSYLISRFGNKIAENIDLSSFKMFTKK